MRTVRTVGVVEEDPERGLVKIAKPVGVVAAIVPNDRPGCHAAGQSAAGAEGSERHRRGPASSDEDTTAAVVEYMRSACTQVGAPADLVQMLAQPSISKTQELMRQADLVVATGGAAMVKAAYSSGTPAYGVGVGNAVHVVDETADLDDAAAAIASAKTFDYATSCLADNAVVAEASIYDGLVDRLVASGGFLCNTAEKALLQQRMWPDEGTFPRRM